LAGCDVELYDAMVLVIGGLGRGIALALLGHDVDQDRAFLGVPHISQHWQKVIEVMAVDGPDIEKTEFLEQGPASDKAARIFLNRPRPLFQELGQALGELMNDM